MVTVDLKRIIINEAIIRLREVEAVNAIHIAEV